MAEVLPLHGPRRVHRHASGRQPARRLHQRRRHVRRADAAARPRDQLLRDGLRAAFAGGRRLAAADLHPGSRGAVRRASRRWGPHSPSQGRCKARSFASRPAPASCRSSSSARARSSCSAGCSSRFRRSRPSPTPRSSSPRCASSASELPIEVYDNGFRHVFVALPTPADVAAVRPDLERLEAVLGDVGVSVFSAGDGRRQDPHVLFGPRHGRGPGDRLGGRTACGASRASRANRLGRAAHDLAGRGGRAAEHAVRSGRRRRRRSHERGSRRQRRGGRERRVPGLTELAPDALSSPAA